MKLTDKRFWIFEGFVLLYGVVQLLIANYSVGDLYISEETTLRPVGLLLLTGVITWLIATGRKWVVFALVFEAIYLVLTAFMYMPMEVYYNPKSLEDALYESFGRIAQDIIATGLWTIAPTLLLSFLGYHLPKKYYNQCNRINNERN